MLGGSSGHSSLIEVRTAHDLLVEFPLLGLLLSTLSISFNCALMNPLLTYKTRKMFLLYHGSPVLLWMHKFLLPSLVLRPCSLR